MLIYNIYTMSKTSSNKKKDGSVDESTEIFKQEFSNFIKTYYVEPVDLVKDIDDLDQQFNTCNKFYIVLSEISNELRNKRDQFQASIKDIFAKKSQLENKPDEIVDSDNEEGEKLKKKETRDVQKEKDKEEIKDDHKEDKDDQKKKTKPKKDKESKKKSEDKDATDTVKENPKKVSKTKSKKEETKEEIKEESEEEETKTVKRPKSKSKKTSD
jgi:hypothetical protein